MFKEINAIEFNKKFFDNDLCYAYLLEKKWGKGFACSRCNHKEFKKGRTSYNRRCKQCGYEESVTANTIFHGIKMPLIKAFHIIFRLTAKKKGMSTIELGAEVGVEQKTAWLLKRKIQVVMKESKDKLTGDVDIDEMLVGGHSKGTWGRTLVQKSAVMVAVENLPDGRTGNINFRLLDNFSALTMKYAIKEMTEPEARLKSDRHQSYQSLSRELGNLKTVPFTEGKNFEQLHKQIMMFKNWLRGIHHKCSKQHLHAYLDEYKYRFNKRNMRRWLFNDTIQRMMHYSPHPYPVLKGIDAYST
jgi:hypothetical protein